MNARDINAGQQQRIIRGNEVDRRCATTPYLRRQWVMCGLFPRPVVLREQRGGVPPLYGWYEHEIDEWVTTRPRAGLNDATAA